MTRSPFTPAHQFGLMLQSEKLNPIPEFKFHPTRKWRFDYAFPEHKIAIEIEGGIWIHGRHTRGRGYEKDLEKYAEALTLGWRVLRIGDKMIRSGKALEIVKQLLTGTENTLVTPNQRGRNENTGRRN